MANQPTPRPNVTPPKKKVFNSRRLIKRGPMVNQPLNKAFFSNDITTQHRYEASIHSTLSAINSYESSPVNSTSINLYDTHGVYYTVYCILYIHYLSRHINSLYLNILLFYLNIPSKTYMKTSPTSKTTKGAALSHKHGTNKSQPNPTPGHLGSEWHHILPSCSLFPLATSNAAISKTSYHVKTEDICLSFETDEAPRKSSC